MYSLLVYNAQAIEVRMLQVRSLPSVIKYMYVRLCVDMFVFCCYLIFVSFFSVAIFENENEEI